MISCIKTELRKALKNRMFFLSLLIGVLICILDVIQNADAVRRLTAVLVRSDDTINKACETFSLFIRWIAVNGYTFGNNAFYIVWPILAAMPYGWSYFEERKAGVYNQVVTKVGINAYFTAKYIAVFTSGGLAISLPVLFNLLANALICPYCKPNIVTSLTSVSNGFFLSNLFYSEPWAYSFIWCFVEFIWGGVTACLCLAAGTKLRHQVTVLLAPFASFFLIDATTAIISSILPDIAIELSPLRLAQAAPDSANPAWLILLIIGVLFVGTYIFSYWQVVKREFA